LYGGRIKPWSDSLRVLWLPNAPAAAAQVEPAGGGTEAQGEASRAVPPPGRAARGIATPAVAVREVQPQIPAGIRSRIEARTVVPVEVRVNRNGRVTSANSAGSGGGVYRYLARAAAKAARSWRFTPAKSADGRPVESRKTVQFIFEPAVER
jgi:TonB family protein